jgi:hypothetical protein
MRRDLRQLLRRAEAAGWQVQLTRHGCRLRLTHPDGGVVVSAGMPKDHRALADLRATLRQAERRVPA